KLKILGQARDHLYSQSVVAPHLIATLDLTPLRVLSAPRYKKLLNEDIGRTELGKWLEMTLPEIRLAGLLSEANKWLLNQKNIISTLPLSVQISTQEAICFHMLYSKRPNACKEGIDRLQKIVKDPSQLIRLKVVL